MHCEAALAADDGMIMTVEMQLLADHTRAARQTSITTRRRPAGIYCVTVSRA